MSKRERKVVIITGASSGIGMEAARLFAKRGDSLVVAARRSDRLKEVADELERTGAKCLVMPTDLSNPDNAEELIRITMENFSRIDVLVNNAGFGSQIFLENQPWDEIEKMFNVNVLSLIALSKAVIPVMRAQGGGSLVNIASVGGVVPHPLNAVYCATKHAVVGFTRSLRLELKGTGIRATVICPGGTRTEYFDVAKRDIPFPDFFHTLSAPADKVAESIVRHSDHNHSIVFPTWVAKLQAFMEKWFRSLSELGNISYRNRVVSSMKSEN